MMRLVPNVPSAVLKDIPGQSLDFTAHFRVADLLGKVMDGNGDQNVPNARTFGRKFSGWLGAAPVVEVVHQSAEAPVE